LRHAILTQAATTTARHKVLNLRKGCVVAPKLAKLVVAIVTFTLPIVALVTPARAATADGPSDMAGWVNSLRASAGAAPLATDPSLTSVAQQWANKMASTGALAHNPNLSTQAPSGWSAIGENIGDGFSLTATYNALVASPPHYANMVNSAFNRTGIGVATDSSGQVWVTEDFGDYPPPVPAAFVFPTDGDVIFPSAQSFSWGQVPGAVYYCLTVGTTKGAVDLLNTGALPASQLSYTVPALPGGHILWARIYTFVQGTWIISDTSFSVTGGSPATFTRPTPGTLNVSTSTPFTWTPVASAQYVWINVGTSEGGYNVFYSALLPGSQTSYTMPALPTGEVLWLRLYSYMGGNWVYYGDVPITAAAH
jgi:uncharacterized protein YkwD